MSSVIFYITNFCLN